MDEQEYKDYIDLYRNDTDNYDIYEKFCSDSDLKGYFGKKRMYTYLIPILKDFDEYKLKYNTSFCAKCGNKLTDQELRSRSCNDFNICCEKHKECRSKFQINL